jgi:formyl-CoA transferase
MDVIVQAHSGMAHFTEHGPAPAGDAVIDYAAALLLAWGISTALYHRERTGIGQKLNVALLQAALVLQNNTVNHIDVIDGWHAEFAEYLKTAFAEGKTWKDVLEYRSSLLPDAFGRAYYGYFQTSDGTIAIAAGGRPNQLRMLKLLGLDDPWVTQPGWLPADGPGHVETMHSKVAAIIASQPSHYWIEVFHKAGVPAAVTQMKEQVIEDQQSWANGFFVRLEHELVGGLTVAAPPVKFSASPLAANSASPPLGRHSRQILHEAGLDDASIERLVSDGAVVVSS